MREPEGQGMGGWDGMGGMVGYTHDVAQSMLGDQSRTKRCVRNKTWLAKHGL